MSDIRKPNLIIDEIRDLDKIIKLSKNYLIENPYDEISNFLLEQNNFRRDILVSELQKSKALNKEHMLKFIFKDFSESLNLRKFIDSLKIFQDVLDETMDLVTNHKRKYFSLNLNTVFSGSLGILLSSDFDDKFIDSDYENTLNFFFETIVEINENKDKIDKIIEKRFKKDKNIISKYTSLFEKILFSGSSVSIEWDNISSKNRKVDITIETIKEIYSFLKKYDNSEINFREINGIIKAIDLTNNTIKIEYNKDNINIKPNLVKVSFNKTQYESVASNLDRKKYFELKESKKFNEATAKEEYKYILLEIKDNLS